MSWSGVSEEKSAAGWSALTSPAPSMTSSRATRSGAASASSAATQPPIELPATVTPARSSSASRRA